jgi:hypothetical protein
MGSGRRAGLQQKNLNRDTGTAVATLSVKHSGGVGDIIYSIPTLLSLIRDHRIARVVYHLQLDQHMQYSGPHPLGTLLLSRDYVEKLRPLLLSQPYIQQVEIYSGQKIDVDFDQFRRIPLNYSMYSIARWYFLLVIGASWDLSRPWLKVDPDYRFKDFVLIARNRRLQSPFITYNFLDKYADQIVFVGVPQEFDDFRTQCPSCTRFYEATDFLELARVIAGCRFVAGNQGFVYTLAEALKVPRLLETNIQAANNIPQGGDCCDALFQQGFEYWFARLLERASPIETDSARSHGSARE